MPKAIKIEDIKKGDRVFISCSTTYGRVHGWRTVKLVTIPSGARYGGVSVHAAGYDYFFVRAEEIQRHAKKGERV